MKNTILSVEAACETGKTINVPKSRQPSSSQPTPALFIEMLAVELPGAFAGTSTGTWNDADADGGD